MQERLPGDTQFDEELGEGDTVNVERVKCYLLLSASAPTEIVFDAIDRALKRMDVGTYSGAGLRGLSVERLEAIPVPL